MISALGAFSPTTFLDATGIGVTSPAGGVTAGGPSFASMVSEKIGATVDQMKQTEQMSIDALSGKGDMRAVVDSVMSAEQSLQAAVAIRDKIVTAFLEVSRMAI